MGGVSVPFRNPSQLKPSNHLKGGKNPKLDGCSTKRKENGLNNKLHLPQILTKNLFGIFPVIFFWDEGGRVCSNPMVTPHRWKWPTLTWEPFLAAGALEAAPSLPKGGSLPQEPQNALFPYGIGLVPHFVLKDVPLVVFLRFAQGERISLEPPSKNIHPIHSCCREDGRREDPARMDGINCSWNGSLTCSHPNKLLRHHLRPPMGPKGGMNLHYG